VVCLDTDFMVALLRKDRDALEYARSIENEARLCTTPVNAYELFQGAYRSLRREENTAMIEELLSTLEVLAFDIEASRVSGSITADLVRRGNALDPRDALIGGIVKRHEEALLTRNIDHFSRISGLRINKW
jgi:predicted nucleic acid-binding protein